MIKAIVKIVCLLVAIAYYTIAERKIMGAIQRRYGPNVVGFWGLLQPLADGLKLIAKELVIPSHANDRIFILAPLSVFMLTILAWSVIPLGCIDPSGYFLLIRELIETLRNGPGRGLGDWGNNIRWLGSVATIIFLYKSWQYTEHEAGRVVGIRPIIDWLMGRAFELLADVVQFIWNTIAAAVKGLILPTIKRGLAGFKETPLIIKATFGLVVTATIVKTVQIIWVAITALGGALVGYWTALKGVWVDLKATVSWVQVATQWAFDNAGSAPQAAWDFFTNWVAWYWLDVKRDFPKEWEAFKAEQYELFIGTPRRIIKYVIDVVTAIVGQTGGPIVGGIRRLIKKFWEWLSGQGKPLTEGPEEEAPEPEKGPVKCPSAEGGGTEKEPEVAPEKCEGWVEWLKKLFSDSWITEFGASDLHYGLLAILAISSFSAYWINLAGWSSNSKYAFLGALRSAAQMISYEVSVSLALLPVVIMSATLNLTRIVLMQAASVWFGLPLLPLTLVFGVSMVAETNRTPFDLPEAEAELVAGYNVDYSSIAFAMFFLAEYGNMILATIIYAIFFLGGWAVGALVLKGLFFCFLFVLIRATLPRYRYDQLMEIGWKIFLPAATGFLLLLNNLLYIFRATPTIEECYI